MTRIAGPQKDDKTGTWWFITDVGVAANGRRRQARRRGFPTRKSAQDELDRTRVAAREQTFVAPTTITLGAYLDAWLDSLTTRGTSPSTIASYRRNLALHVRPTLGAGRLQALSAPALDSLYARLLASGRRDGRGGLSPRTVRYIHTILRKALADAARKGIVPRNVVADADPPTAKAARAPEMAWWAPEELAHFLAQVEDEDLFPLFRLTPDPPNEVALRP